MNFIIAHRVVAPRRNPTNARSSLVDPMSFHKKIARIEGYIIDDVLFGHGPDFRGRSAINTLASWVLRAYRYVFGEANLPICGQSQTIERLEIAKSLLQ